MSYAIWPTDSVYFDALELVGETRYSFYDCLILAAAIESGATRLRRTCRMEER